LWWKALATHYDIQPKSHFLKFDPNDWFCAGGSHISIERNISDSKTPKRSQTETNRNDLRKMEEKFKRN
jgi:hypothetical protein